MDFKRSYSRKPEGSGLQVTPMLKVGISPFSIVYCSERKDNFGDLIFKAASILFSKETLNNAN